MFDYKYKNTILMLVFGFTALIVSSQASATLIDPATLHIGAGSTSGCDGSNSGSPTCPYLYNGGAELTAIGQKTLDIYQNSGGSAVDSPLYLIMGVVNDNSGSVFDTSSVSASLGATSVGVNSVTAISTLMNSTNSDAYTIFNNAFGGGWTPTDNSNSFKNWSGADSSVLGITANYFQLYAIELASSLPDKSSLDVAFANDIPIGTFAIAIGKNSTKGLLFDTAFTNAGLETTCTTRCGGSPPQGFVPEPATLALFGLGLVGLGFTKRRVAA